MLTPQQFVQQWDAAQLKESASYASHFEALCRLVGHPLPHEIDPKGEFFTYQHAVRKDDGKQGFADVWYKGHFAIEYKGKEKYKDLSAAYDQLLRYREALENPPLLVVSDITNWEIHTNFPNTQKKVYRFTNQDIVKPDTRRLLHETAYLQDYLDQLIDQANVLIVATDLAGRITVWNRAMNRLTGFMYTVRLLSRWSSTSSASPPCCRSPVRMKCQQP